MSTFSRFLPFLKPYLSRMVLAGLLVMGVAAINLALLRLAGTLWDVITVQHDQSRMTDMITVFLGLVVLQGFCSMGHSYLTAWISQRIIADFRRHLFAHLHTPIGELFLPPANRRTPLTAHERCDGRPVGRHRDADRQCETARDLRRRDHVLADDELAALPLDPASAPFARPRGQVLRAKAEVPFDLDSRPNRCIEYPDRGSDLRHPDREVLRPITA